jgi:hypothetical protein
MIHSNSVDPVPTGKLRRSLVRMSLVSTVGAIGAILSSGAAYAEQVIRSLPYTETFDSSTYAATNVWLTGGATHTWLSTGGWRGGAAKFTPPTSAQSYGGLGQYLLSGLQQVPEQLNVRWLMYHGATWRENGSGEKLIILNRNGNGGRPMIILRESQASGTTYETLGACDGTVCRYDGGDFWPDGTDRLKIGNRPVAREQEWISIEFEANTRTGMIRLYIDSQDGQLSGLYIQKPMDDNGPGGVWSHIDVIGGYFNEASPANPENYFLIDELVVSSQRIGPPAGFVSTVRPASPTNLSAQ